MVRCDAFEHIKPEGADLRKNATFVGNAIRHDDIVSADSIGSDDQQMFGQLIDITNFPTSSGIVLDSSRHECSAFHNWFCTFPDVPASSLRFFVLGGESILLRGLFSE